MTALDLTCPVEAADPNSRPAILDLFAGEGGAGTGYARAGFSVYAVDNDPKRLARNPFPSHCGDAIDVMTALLAGDAVGFTHKDGRVEWLTLDDFAAIHASPPCTGYTRGTATVRSRGAQYARLIGLTRELLIASCKPYVIENVADAVAELRNPMMLCWSMFHVVGSVRDEDGTPLRMERHRLFESNVFLFPPATCYHPRAIQVAGAYRGARRTVWEARELRRGGYVPASLAVLRELTGLSWASEQGCYLSIPPAYTEHIGLQLLER